MDEEYNAELDDGSASGLNNEAGRPRVRKAVDAFRTISEVADELHVPQHVLRFWETKFPQVRPLKRGGGRRYYRPEDVGLLRRVADLLYTQGYTIKGVQRLLRDGGMATDAPPERSPAPVQDFLIPPEPPPQRAANPVPEAELEDFIDPIPAAEADPAYDLPPIPEPMRPQAAAGSAEGDEATRLRALLAETLSVLEDLRRALN